MSPPLEVSGTRGLVPSMKSSHASELLTGWAPGGSFGLMGLGRRLRSDPRLLSAPESTRQCPPAPPPVFTNCKWTSDPQRQACRQLLVPRTPLWQGGKPRAEWGAPPQAFSSVSDAAPAVGRDSREAMRLRPRKATPDPRAALDQHREGWTGFRRSPEAVSASGPRVHPRSPSPARRDKAPRPPQRGEAHREVKRATGPGWALGSGLKTRASSKRRPREISVRAKGEGPDRASCTEPAQLTGAWQTAGRLRGPAGGKCARTLQVLPTRNRVPVLLDITDERGKPRRSPL